MGSVAHVEEEMKKLMKDVHNLSHLGVRLMSILHNCITLQNGVECSLVVEVKEKQDTDEFNLELKGTFYNQRVEVFSQEGDGVLLYQGRLCVPYVSELRKHILAEAHNSTYFINPGTTKMYCDVQEIF